MKINAYIIASIGANLFISYKICMLNKLLFISDASLLSLCYMIRHPSCKILTVGDTITSCRFL